MLEITGASPVGPIMIFTRILPLNHPVIDWEAYLKHTQAHLGRSVTASLDKTSAFDYSLRSFLYTVSEFSKANSNSLFEAVLKHLSFTFLVTGTESVFVELMSYGLTLTLSEMRTLALTSGNLASWKMVLQSGCRSEASYPCRILCNELVLYFQHIGLGDILGDYKKVDQKDKTFLLERK